LSLYINKKKFANLSIWYTFVSTRNLSQAKEGMVLAYKFQGKRFDCGSIDGFVEAVKTQFIYICNYKYIYVTITYIYE